VVVWWLSVLPKEREKTGVRGRGHGEAKRGVDGVMRQEEEGFGGGKVEDKESTHLQDMTASRAMAQELFKHGTMNLRWWY